MFQWQCKLVLHSQTIFHAMDCKRLPANRQISKWCPRARCTVKIVCKSVHMIATNQISSRLVYSLFTCLLSVLGLYTCVHVSVLVVYNIVHFFWQVVEPNTCTQFNHKILPTSTVRQVCEAPCCGCCECSGRTFMKGARSASASSLFDSHVFKIVSYCYRYLHVCILPVL